MHKTKAHEYGGFCLFFCIHILLLTFANEYQRKFTFSRCECRKRKLVYRSYYNPSLNPFHPYIQPSPLSPRYYPTLCLHYEVLPRLEWGCVFSITQATIRALWRMTLIRVCECLRRSNDILGTSFCIEITQVRSAHGRYDVWFIGSISLHHLPHNHYNLSS